MPILKEIIDHQAIGRAIRHRWEQGRREVALDSVRRVIVKPFGSIPSSAEENLAASSVERLDEIGLRLFDVDSLENR